MRATEKEQRTRAMSPDKKRAAFDSVAAHLCERFEVARPELMGSGRRRAVSEVRRLAELCGVPPVGNDAGGGRRGAQREQGRGNEGRD